MHDKAVYCFSVVHAKVGKEGTMNYNCLFEIIYKNCSLLDTFVMNNESNIKQKN